MHFLFRQCMLHVQPMSVFLIELPLQHYASSKNCKLLITKLYNYIYCSPSIHSTLFCTKLWQQVSVFLTIIRINIRYYITAEILQLIGTYIYDVYSSRYVDLCGRAVQGRLVAGITGSNSAEDMDVCLVCLYVVLSCAGINLSDGLITRPEESYRVSNFVWSSNLSKEEFKAQIRTVVPQEKYYGMVMQDGEAKV
jgi:hypothetical protein